VLISGRAAKVIFAGAVHVFTATGAVCGLFALLAASRNSWTEAFAWLAIALVIDGVDGTFARLAEVDRVLSRFSGEALDHVIDYLNYVIVPAFIVARSDLLPEEWRELTAGLIALVSLYHFSDTQSKTAAGEGFVGFPAVWNLVVFLLFAAGFSAVVNLGVIAACAVLTFVPLIWVHPFRQRSLRPVTVVLLVVAAIASLSCLAHGFPAREWELAILSSVCVYLVALGLWPKATASVTPFPEPTLTKKGG
jgi:phosphatidylcholine synthase